MATKLKGLVLRQVDKYARVVYFYADDTCDECNDHLLGFKGQYI